MYNIFTDSVPTKKTYLDIEKGMYDFFMGKALDNGYTYREKQYDMSEDVLTAIKNQSSLLVEAGVGIGKTFAYLVPILLYYKYTRRPIAIATSTIALQEQLEKDVKVLAQMLGIRVFPIIAKGQTHFICTEKVKEYRGELAKEISEGVKNDCMERTDFAFEIKDEIWEKICVNKYGRQCRQNCKNHCKYHVIRTALAKEDLVICNQNQLTAHLLNRMNERSTIFNEKMSIIVIDEAHNLESKVREVTQTSITKNNLISIIKKSNSSLSRTSRGNMSLLIDRCINATEAFFENLQYQMREQDKKSNIEIDRYNFKEEKGLLRKLSKELDELCSYIDIHLTMEWDFHSGESDDIERIAEPLSKYSSNPDQHVVWIERNGTFCFCPEDIAGMTHELYFNNEQTCILTSATLTGRADGGLNEQYAYVANGIGFNKTFSEPKESPFNYDDHAMIYVSDGLPHPTKEHKAFINEGTKLLNNILDISNGRALILFTSKKDMLDVYDSLQNGKYRVLMQRHGSSQKETLDAFREDEHSVLLGTGAYWEGINVEGKTLSNVVIFRLPFPVPDPILESKCKRSSNPLMDVRVPEMILKLKQGVGRLIRSEEDRGIISIIDSRIGEESNAPYKDIVWDALPIKRRTSDLDEIKRFYKGNVEI